MDCQKTGDIISKSRKEKNMTQKDLADLLNISDRTVSKWERGLGCPDISIMIPLSKALGIGLYELLGGEEMEKSSKVKANTVIENTINDTSKKIKTQIIIYKIIITVSLLIIIGIIMFWLFVKFHYMILYRPENVKYSKLIEYNELLDKNSCVLTLENQSCEFDDGTFTAIASIEYKVNLPKWYAHGGYRGFEINTEAKQMAMSITVIGEKNYKEKYINNYRIFDKNYTKKSMVVTSLVYFVFVEDLESIYYDFGDTSYLVERDKVEQLFETKYVKLEDLLKNNNWDKYVIKNLNKKDFISEFLNI